ncbi:MAG: AAC(3) family N-acetyltransferase [Clostridia bacterium]|nr:AAC(3) family N-acetyltransferase [Clostridia bacterium]
MTDARMLHDQLAALGIDPRGTLLVHSSMKAIGEVDGGADTVLDVLSDYMKDGLLVLPTHTWRQMNEQYTVFDVANEPSCVGLLTNLFRVRPGVVRSFHPTHSVAALGADAEDYTAGEELTRTPCPRTGCWGKLCDRRATILFIGCTLKNNTFMHGVEEWCGTPNRLADKPQAFTVIAPDGRRFAVPQFRHHTTPPPVDVSEHYDKMEPVFVKEHAVSYGTFGQARCIVADAARMADITTPYLLHNPHLFDDDQPIRI